MRYGIYKNANLINTITCDPSFIDEYCTITETTYTLLGDDMSSDLDNPQPSFEETANAKIQALIDQQAFLEDCIAEMAMIVYE